MSQVTSIQYLQFIAALLVVVYHVTVQTEIERLFGRQFKLGAIGVDIFFVISGFVMTLILLNQDRHVNDFAVGRLVRIAPSYWLITIVIGTLGIARPDLFRQSEFSALGVVTSLLFIPHEQAAGIYPTLIPGWTLNCEVFFYGLIAISLAITKSNIAPIFAAILLLITIITSNIVIAMGFTNVFLRFYGNTISIEFIFGIALGYLYRHQSIECGDIRWSGFGVIVAILMTVLPSYFFSDEREPRWIFWGIPSVLLVWAGISFRARSYSAPTLVLLGDASYAIYLLHLPVFGMLRSILRPGEMTTSGLVVYAFSCVIGSVVAGVAFWILIDHPLQKSFKQWRQRREIACGV